MADVRITYCVPCRYQGKALQDADAILRAFGQKIARLELIPGDHGVYDVAIDGEVVFSLDREYRFPKPEELIEKIRPHVPEGA